jgi:uncharacterized protein YkwD
MRSRRLRRIVLTAAALFAFVFVAACGPDAPPPPSSPAAADSVARHNDVRAINGIGGLTVDGAMQANAQYHADRLASGASSCGATLWHSGELATWYAGFSAGENIACVPGCPDNAEAAFTMWLASAPHAANVTNPGYTRIGVATSCNGSVQMVVAQYRSG